MIIIGVLVSLILGISQSAVAYEITSDNWYSLPGDELYPTRQEIQELRESIKGDVYDQESTFNQRLSRPPPWQDGCYGGAARPAVVVRVTGATDVSLAIAFARRHRLRITAYSTGHEFKCRSNVENGMLIDCSDMQSIDVDIEKGIVTVGTGNAMRDVLRAVNRQTNGQFTVISGYCGGVGPYGFSSGGGNDFNCETLNQFMFSAKLKQIIFL